MIICCFVTEYKKFKKTMLAILKQRRKDSVLELILKMKRQELIYLADGSLEMKLVSKKVYETNREISINMKESAIEKKL
jgi:hypothetical protein